MSALTLHSAHWRPPRQSRWLPMAFPPLRHAPSTPADWSRFRVEILPHFDAAYNFARYLVRDGAAAEDLMQTAMVRALNGHAGFRGGSARAWLFTIIRNCHASGWGATPRHMRVADIEDQLISDDPTPEDAALTGDIAARLRAIIATLPQPFREVLVLRELEELSYREIADVIDAPIGTVMSRLARARSLLADAWRTANPEPCS